MKQVSNDRKYPVSICFQDFDMVQNRTEHQDMWKQATNYIGIESEVYISKYLTFASLFLK